MEAQDFDLIWIPHPVMDCIQDGQTLDLYHTEIEIHGPYPILYTFEMGHCAECDTWYALLPDLDDAMSEEEWSFDQVERFVLGEDEAVAGISLRLSTPLPWRTFREHVLSSKTENERPTPSVEEVRALEQRPVTWEVNQRPVTWLGEADQEPQLTYAVVVHDPNFLRSTYLAAGGPVTADDFDDLIRRAAGVPSAPGTPGRPRTLRLPSDMRTDAVVEAMDRLGIRVEAGATPLADEALQEVSRYFQGAMAPPYFSAYPPDAVHRFFEAAECFVEAAPWERFRGDVCLGLRWDDRPWMYVNVMGQRGETPGLSVFDDWITLCRFMNADYSPLIPYQMEATPEDYVSPLDAAGTLEAASGSHRNDLHPEDAAFLDDLGRGALPDYGYPVPHRYDSEQGPIAAAHPPQAYALMFDVVTRLLEARPGADPVQAVDETLTVQGIDVDVVYPADGTERPLPEDAAPAYAIRFATVRRTEEDALPAVLQRGAPLVIHAPAGASLRTVAHALADIEDEFAEAAFFDGPVCLWADTIPTDYPDPRVHDLVEIGDVLFASGSAEVELVFDPLENPVDEVMVEVGNSDE